MPTLEPGGPRRKVFHAPGATRAGIVTCGGLCPGLNDVIRGLVMELKTHYGVSDVVGFRNGFAGLVKSLGHDPIELSVERVSKINMQGGTILGTSRGAQDPEVMVDRLVELGIDILFVIGGDGSIRGAGKLAAVARGRGLPIGVIGIPKTIDNDIPFIGQSFGFQTAFTVAAQSIAAAQVEAQSAINGVGLVKLMGRHAGFIACYAALANHHADFVLIPEVPFALEGESGFLAALERRVADRGSAVVVVAEGAGQELMSDEQTGHRRVRQPQARRHRQIPGGRDCRALQVHRPRADAQVPQARLFDPVGAGQGARLRVLRAARSGRRPCGNGGTDGHGGGAPAQPIRARPD